MPKSWVARVVVTGELLRRWPRRVVAPPGETGVFAFGEQ